MKKIMLVLAAVAVFLVGCDWEETEVAKDKEATMEVTEKLVKNQPTPTDIDYSLERFNLIKRAYWVNGQREKALALVSAVDRPLGYVVLFTDSGAPVGEFVIDGKVTSLNSYLTPDSEAFEGNGGSISFDADQSNLVNDWLADVDGSYGENDKGIFFFTAGESKYVEWSGTYIYSDIPFSIENPVLTVEQK